jgi:serine/threonine protein kinase
MGTSVPAARLGRYELLARLASGGMGEIFLARLEGAAGFEKLFVVKRILPHLADDARFRAMLIAEARIASKMSHANICQVYELGDADGQLYIVMEYLEGVAMLPLLRRASKEATPLDFGLVAGVVQQATDALHYAHELKDRNGDSLGIVHRDVTPGNIFLTEAGVAKVLDFGIAKVKDASAHTQTGTVKGKYAYMAPEQLRGAAVDRRADIFALGVVIYEMLALRRLFQRKTDYLTFRAVMEQPIPDIRRYREDTPDALAEALGRALDREPLNRFETARQLGTVVVDAVAKLHRPWGQGEIGDYVRTTFADDIGKRSAQVATAIQRSEASGAGVRPTMPLLVQAEPGDTSDDDDDDEFPAVDTAGNELVDPRVRPPSPQFHGQTPPPFAGDSHTSSPGVPVPRPSQQVVVVAKRSLFWPLVAIAMVVIAAGALILVWKQTQQPQQPSVVNITASPDNEPVVKPDPVKQTTTPAAPGTGSGSGSASQPVVLPPKPPPKPSPSAAYTDAIRARNSEINKCAREHGAPPANASVVILVATNGHAKTVSLEPAALNASPLGTCIKSALWLATFPSSKDEKQVKVTLNRS